MTFPYRPERLGSTSGWVQEFAGEGGLTQPPTFLPSSRHHPLPRCSHNEPYWRTRKPRLSACVSWVMFPHRNMTP